MNKAKLTVKIIALTLAVIMPFVAVFAVAFLLPAEFDESFAGALDEKLDRLHSISEDKIVIIGGSSAAFGYDSKFIEKYLGMPVVNLGLYAALGTKIMLDLSRDGIEDGDIVIIAPELDAQTLSMYFSASTALRALDGSPKYLLDIPTEHTVSLLGQSWSFAAEKLNYKLMGSPEYEGIYNSQSFNKYGDVGVERPENLMEQYYEPNILIDLDSSIVDKEFLDYLNEYIAYCKSVGARVFFQFCPMNRLGLNERSLDEEKRYAFEKYLRKNLDCTLIASSIEDYIYDEAYFYDSNFHLNSTGASMHTMNVTRDLLLELEIPRSIEEELPSPPPLPKRDIKFFGEDENAVFFEYEKLESGAYRIIGVADEYKDEKTLTVPLGYNGYKVTAIGSEFLRGSDAEKLIVTENTNLRQIDNGAFLGASSLSELWMCYKAAEDIPPPLDFEGVAEDFKVYIPIDSNYKIGGYYWSERGLTFEYIMN